MFETLKSKKVSVSITIDKELREKLKEIKEKNLIVNLSPMINELLWEWVKKQVEKKNG